MKINIALCCTAMLAATFFNSCEKESQSVKNSFSVDQNTEAIDLKKGLIAWYPFNGNTLDSSGKGNNVIFSNATPSKGQNGIKKNAYSFDGATTYMKIANSKSLNPTGAITLYAFVKPVGFYQGVCHANYIISKGFNLQAQGKYNLAFADALYYNYTQCNQPVLENFENFYGTYGDGEAACGVDDSTGYIKLGKWYKVTYTYDGSKSKIYLNGVLKSTAKRSGTFTPNTSDLFIGKMEGSFGNQYPYFFNGIIDDIKIYKRALTAAEVAAL